MAINEDILEVLREVGTACTVRQPDGTVVTGEYMDFVTHTEHTTPLIRGWFIDFTLHHPTAANIGDIIEYGPNSKRVILLTKEVEMFENEPVDYLASGYTANVEGEFQDYVEDDGWDADYEKVQSWVTLHSNVMGTQMDRLFRSNVIGIADESMNAELDRMHLYVSGYYSDVKMGMRWVPNNGAGPFKIDQIEPYMFPGIHLCFISEDHRE